jgi:hypothetical protein
MIIYLLPRSFCCRFLIILVCRLPDADVEGSVDGWVYALSFKSLDAGNILNATNPRELRYSSFVEQTLSTLVNE